MPTMRAKYIRFPTEFYVNSTKLKFFNKYGFPGMLSATDGLLVPMLSPCPSAPDKEEYRNRKGYYSIHVMGTDGADLEFINIVTRWKGSTEYTNTWLMSVEEFSYVLKIWKKWNQWNIIRREKERENFISISFWRRRRTFFSIK